MRILIIDDSKMDRELIKTYLSENESKESIIADESSNLTDAFVNINNKEYDAILLDLRLPDTHGLETIEKAVGFLKKCNTQPPIIILTGVEDYNIGRQALSMGIQDFLIKGESKAKEILRALSFAVYDNKKFKTKKSLRVKKK